MMSLTMKTYTQTPVYIEYIVSAAAVFSNDIKKIYVEYTDTKYKMLKQIK